RSSTKTPQLPRAVVPFYMEKYTKHTAAILLLSLLFLGCFVSQAQCRGMVDLGGDEKISVDSRKCQYAKVQCIFNADECYCCAHDEKCARTFDQCRVLSSCHQQ
ncbi:hypothetical protein EJB05_24960, partial [Eragrostis curvula]